MKLSSGLIVVTIVFGIADCVALSRQQQQARQDRELVQIQGREQAQAQTQTQTRQQKQHREQEQKTQNQNVRPRVVALPLHRSEISDPIAHDKTMMLRRRTTVSHDVDNLKTLYYFNASLGTPPQNVRLHLDTGSNNMWVNTPESPLCEDRGVPLACFESGTYSANASSTYKYTGSSFDIYYADGSSSAGDYATDIMRFSDQSLSGFVFGIGYRSTSPQNILGLGYFGTELMAQPATKARPYQSLSAKFFADGLTTSNSFSLSLNDIHAPTGHILFGGLDTGRFQKPLIRVPVERINDEYSQFFITMTGLSMGYHELATGTSFAVLIDSGTSLTYLPDDLTARIYRLLSVAYSESQNAALVPCSLRDQNLTMTFYFSSPAAITVQLSDMILDAHDSSTPAGTPLILGGDGDACILGILPATDHANILGDTFLRAAYLVFDMDRHEIALANVNPDVTHSNIVEIPSGVRRTVPFSSRATAIVAATEGLPLGRFLGEPPPGLRHASASTYQQLRNSSSAALSAFTSRLAKLY
ncbi:hypothetical protein E4U21_005318 [Claviceps maximensis]|nr:hypothetical protein E4U21_005318 [Claviceps maximensis]